MPDPTRNVSNKWTDVDAAASAIKNGVQKTQLAGAVQLSLGKADTALQPGDQATKTAAMTEAVGVDANGKLWTTPGGGGSDTFIGTTPVTLNSPTDGLVLKAQGSTSYAVQSNTKAIFEIGSGSLSSASLSEEDGVYTLTAGNAANWYSSYIDILISGLQVGETYNLCVDAQGMSYDYSTTSVGHYILYDSEGVSLASRGTYDEDGLHTYEFTATTTGVKLRWYPATNSTYVANTSKALVRRFYINAEDTSTFSPVIDLSGTFSGERTLGAMPAGVVVTSTPSCDVFGRSSSGGGGALPLQGKKAVVFGDSIIGMVRGEGSVTAYLEERYGATAVNVGFGGCRMSTHPTTGYAEFSMWALADAVAAGDFTDQEAAASSGESYFADQLEKLEAVDFTKVDYVIIHYGTNDFGGGVQIGRDASSATHDTLCGALRYSVEKLLNAYPKLRIFVSLPIFRYWSTVGGNIDSNAYENANHDKLFEFVLAMRDVAREYNLPVIDGYYGLGVTRKNMTTFLSDGTHPSQDGRRRLGEFMGACLAGETAAPTVSVPTKTSELTNDSGFVSVTVETVSGSTPQITPVAGHIYKCGTVATIEITGSYAAAGDWIVEFDTPQNVDVGVTLPQALSDRLPSGFTFERNTHYEINVHDGYPLAAGVPI